MPEGQPRGSLGAGEAERADEGRRQEGDKASRPPRRKGRGSGKEEGGTPPTPPRHTKGARRGLLLSLPASATCPAEPGLRLTQPAPLLLLLLRLLQPRPRSVPAAATAPRAVGFAATVAAQSARSLTRSLTHRRARRCRKRKPQAAKQRPWRDSRRKGRAGEQPCFTAAPQLGFFLARAEPKKAGRLGALVVVGIMKRPSKRDVGSSGAQRL